MLLSLASIYATCRKHLDCRETVYNFEMGIKAYPDRDSIHVGDTVWLEVDESTMQADVITGGTINFTGASNLGSAIGFKKLSSATNMFTIDAVQKLDFFLVKGKEVTNTLPSLYKEYFFAEENNRYIFKLGVVPKESGVFILVFSNATGVVRKSDNCTKASFILNFENTNQHHYLNPSFPGGTVAPGGDYYFKVY